MQNENAPLLIVDDPDLSKSDQGSKKPVSAKALPRNSWERYASVD